MMPEYEVYVNGRIKKVDLTRNGEEAYAATVDGKTRSFTVTKNALESGKPSTIKINDKPYKIQVTRTNQPREFSVTVEETSFKTEVKIPLRKSALAAFEPAATATRRTASTSKQTPEGAVNAPMTGKIVAIKVTNGENVKPKQVLCVIEAMKMENEITAPKAGIVKEVLVSVGSPVSEGDPLVVIG